MKHHRNLKKAVVFLCFAALTLSAFACAPAEGEAPALKKLAADRNDVRIYADAAGPEVLTLSASPEGARIYRGRFPLTSLYANRTIRNSEGKAATAVRHEKNHSAGHLPRGFLSGRICSPAVWKTDQFFRDFEKTSSLALCESECLDSIVCSDDQLIRVPFNVHGIIQS